MLLSGTLFYVREEGLSVIDALYFCITTLSTVGHPAFEPQILADSRASSFVICCKSKKSCI